MRQAITQTNSDQISRSQKASLRPQWVYVVPNLVTNDNIIEPSYTKFLTVEPRPWLVVNTHATPSTSDSSQKTRILMNPKPKLRAGREGKARLVFLAAVRGEVAITRVFSTGTSNPRGSQHAPQMPNHIRLTR